MSSRLTIELRGAGRFWLAIQNRLGHPAGCCRGVWYALTTVGPKHEDRLADSLDTLAGAIASNTCEMKVLREAIDDLRISYEHAVRNAECPYLAEAALKRARPAFPLDDALETGLVQSATGEGGTTDLGLRRIETNARSDEIPETIACAVCDVDSPPSLAAALQEGWTRLQRDDGPGWNYLGVCPVCDARENAPPEPETPPAQQQNTLFG